MSYISTLFFRIGVGLLTAALCLPLLHIAGSWFTWDSEAWAQLKHLQRTVLPAYASTSLILCLGVAVGVSVLGGLSAILITFYEFPLRRIWQWAVLLPLAMPGYVVAYAYADFLEYSRLAQTGFLPPIRSVGGAIAVMSLTLYPYVYLLTRSALLGQSANLMDAATLLGAGRLRIFWRIALPLARPGIAAGVALALMETLADFGVSSYLGVQTLTTSIYKAWLVHHQASVAAGLSTLLLIGVGVLLWIEKRAQANVIRHSPAMSLKAASWTRQRLHSGWGWLASGLTGVPVMLGSLFPIGILAYVLIVQHDEAIGDLAALVQWTFNSLALASVTAIGVVILAWGLTSWQRLCRDPVASLSCQLLSLGYAVPGVVVVIGLLIPLAWAEQQWPGLSFVPALLATSAALFWAYGVRFTSTAIQTIQSGLSQIPLSLDESARVLGRSNGAIAWHIHWPLLRRPLACAGLLVMIDVVKELPVTLVLRPFDTDTLAVVAYQFARDERLAQAALPSLLLVLLSLIPLFLMNHSLSLPRHRN